MSRKKAKSEKSKTASRRRTRTVPPGASAQFAIDCDADEVPSATASCASAGQYRSGTIQMVPRRAFEQQPTHCVSTRREFYAEIIPKLRANMNVSDAQLREIDEDVDVVANATLRELFLRFTVAVRDEGSFVIQHSDYDDLVAIELDIAIDILEVDAIISEKPVDDFLYRLHVLLEEVMTAHRNDYADNPVWRKLVAAPFARLTCCCATNAVARTSLPRHSQQLLVAADESQHVADNADFCLATALLEQLRLAGIEIPDVVAKTALKAWLASCHKSMNK